MITPNGLQELKNTFGDPGDTSSANSDTLYLWESKILGTIQVPYPMIYAYDPKKTITSFRCHKLLVPVFLDVFNEIYDKHLDSKCNIFGGCYTWRKSRTTDKLSTHCWGIAIDIDPSNNRLGTAGSISNEIVQIFKAHGFFWGGNFKLTKDPMHFQYCTGY